MNWLIPNQNDPDNILWIAASSARYILAKRLLASQFGLSVGIPIVLTGLKIIIPEVSIWAALYGALLTLLDLFLIDSRLKSYLREGALAQESFDCSVLRLEWNSDRIARRPTKADAIEWSSGYLDRNQDHTNWYPSIAGTIPVWAGRLICQLSNCRWDARLRKRYSQALFGSAFLLAILVLLINLALKTTVEVLLLSGFAILPAIIWPLRSWKYQNESTDLSLEHRRRIEGLWLDITSGRADEERATKVGRSIQDDIFLRRKGSQPVFNWIYGRFRTRDETEMNTIASLMVKEFNDRVGRIVR